jgi:hypothetical protein
VRGRAAQASQGIINRQFQGNSKVRLAASNAGRLCRAEIADFAPIARLARLVPIDPILTLAAGSSIVPALPIFRRLLEYAGLVG